MKMKLISAFTASALLGSHAQAESDSTNDSDISIGVSLINQSSEYLQGKSENATMPLIEARWKTIFISGDRVGSFFAGGDHWVLALTTGLDHVGDKDRGDSEKLADMRKLDTVIVAGINAFVESSYGEFSLEVSRDISGGHEGHVAELSYSYSFTSGSWTAYPEIGVLWMSHEVSDYYYGVSEVDARVDRTQYRPGSAFIWSVGFGVSYDFYHHHSVTLSATINRLSDRLLDSPIVEKADTEGLMLGYSYSF
mgnify:FL=1